jgi:hypothetical protein
LIALAWRSATGGAAISIGDPRRDFFSGETVELTSVSVTLDDLALSSAVLATQIELAAATVARSATTCQTRSGRWSGHVGLALPRLERRVDGNLLFRLVADDRVIARMALPVRLYPPRDRFRRRFDGRRFLLLDPKRSLEPILKSNGIEFSPIEPSQLAQSPNLPLLVGREAMSDWSRGDADRWRDRFQSGAAVAIVFAQKNVPIAEFDYPRRDEDLLPPKPIALLFHTALARALRDSAPHRWAASGWSDVPLPLPRADDFVVFALAEPFDPMACCRVVEVIVGKGRAVFVQCAVDKSYESEPGARVLWEALLEEALRPLSETGLSPKAQKEDGR